MKNYYYYYSLEADYDDAHSTAVIRNKFSFPLSGFFFLLLCVEFPKWIDRVWRFVYLLYFFSLLLSVCC
jgi:hypothetical protein